MTTSGEINKLIARMRENKYKEKEIYYCAQLMEYLKKKKMNNLDQYQKVLIERLYNKEQYEDILTEGKIARIFLKNGFEVTYLDFDQKNIQPDLLVEGVGNQFYIKIKRYREDITTIDKLAKYNENIGLVSYGRNDTQKDYQILFRDILEKTKKFPAGKIGIVFIWSENVRIDKGDFKTCINLISGGEEGYKYEKKYENVTLRYIGSSERLTEEEKEQSKKLSGLLFYSKCRSSKCKRLFFFFSNPKAQTIISPDLARKLENLKNFRF